jgi:type I restriction enzyme S subunit
MFDGQSVLFGRKGTVDKPLFVDGKFWTVDTMYYTVIDERHLVPKFLYYVAMSLPFGYWKTDTALPSMTQTDLSSAPIPFPPLDEQEAIADFLDRETAEIDAFIADQQRLIELFAERHAAAVSQALEPKEAWPRLRLGWICTLGNGSTPSRANPAYWSEEGFPWLNSSMVNLPEVANADQFVTERALRECHLPVVPPGSILVGITGQGRTRGMASILRIEATINQHLAFLTPNLDKVTAEYLLVALIDAYGDLRRISEATGSTKGALTVEDLKHYWLAVPPLEEQRAIAVRLDAMTMETEASIADARRAIELLKERRAALISAAVTGQLEMTERHRALTVSDPGARIGP